MSRTFRSSRGVASSFSATPTATSGPSRRSSAAGKACRPKRLKPVAQTAKPVAQREGPVCRSADRCRWAWLVVIDPPLVWWALGVARRRVFPRLLAPKRGEIEVAPGAAHCLVTAGIDEVGTEHAVTVADER